MNVNKCILVGRITKEITKKEITSGSSVASFSIATNRNYKDAAGNKIEKVSFHNIVMWNKLADIAAQYLVKGQEIYVEGRIETRDYTDKDGIKRYATDIVVDNMQMGNKPKAYQDAGASVAPENNNSNIPIKEEIPTIQIGEDETPYQQNIRDIKSGDKIEEVRIEDVPF